MGVMTRFRAGATVLAVAAATVSGAALPSAAAPAPGDFSTSFEEGQPQPADSSVEQGPKGPLQQNVTGTASTDGSLLGQVTDVTASAENAPNEAASSLADANPDTKWLAFEPSGWVRYELAKPATVVKWSMTSANDSPERDPKDVTLQGSADGTTWTDLDRETGLDFPQRFATLDFEVDAPAEYRFYRLDVTANHSGGLVQLADWDISDGTTGPGTVSPMVTRTGPGPISGFNIKPLVGWTGVKALRYSGGHTAAGRGYAWNRLFDVDVPVGNASRLTYKIFPDMVSGDLTYPSTYTAVDLRFTDGTFLSDLRATDAHGTEASPSGQGRGKILYANQWNAVTVELGRVAAGRTVDAILLGYDNPTARPTPASAAGWTTCASREARRRRRPRPDQLRRRPTRHQRLGQLLARQQPADQRAPQRVHVPHAGHRRDLPVVAVLLPVGQRRAEPPCPAGPRGLARAEPVDG